MPYNIIEYNSSYKNELLILLKSIWVGLSDIEIKEKFEWRYEKNPFNENNLTCLAMDEFDQIVGCVSFVEQMFYMENKYKVYVASDAIIHPDHRRGGLYFKIIFTLIKRVSKIHHNGIILALSANEKTTTVLKKLGWSHINFSNRYAYKLSFKNILINLTINKYKNNIEEDKKIGRFVISKEFDIDGLVSFRSGINKTLFQISRTNEYYAWRYQNAPKNNVYYSAYIKKNEVISSYLIVEEITKYRFNVIEYDSKTIKEFKMLVKFVVKNLRIPILRVWSANKSSEVIISKSGFIFERESILKFIGKERYPILVHPAVESLTEDEFYIDSKDIRESDNWKIYEADSH